jgi:hypothetical protein
MSQTINYNVPIVNLSDSFESEIRNKISSFPNYPGPIHNIGGLYVGSNCRIPGVQPIIQPILRPNICIPHCLTKQCYEYGNTRFPPYCECDEKTYCKAYQRCRNRNREVSVINF